MKALKSVLAQDYFKSNNVADTVSSAILDLYNAKPQNPLQYLAERLKAYNHQVQLKKEIQEARLKAKLKIEEDAKAAEQLQKAEQAKILLKKEQDKQIENFQNRLKSSSDPIELVKDLCEFLKKTINATDVYIGMVEQQQKEAKDEDDENAHIDTTAQTVLRYVYDTSVDKIMMGKTLKMDEGVVFEILQKKEEQPKGEEEENKEKEEKTAEKPKEMNKEVTDKSIFIHDVLQEPKIKYFNVPKLGSFLAIKLEYKSCLSEEALDKAVEEYFNTEKKKADLETQKQAKEDEIQRLKEEKEAAGEVFVRPDVVYETAVEPPYLSTPVTYVICMDTLGQSRQFGSAEVQIALKLSEQFTKSLEESENSKLTKDKMMRLEHKKKLEEMAEKELKELQDAEDKAYNDAVNEITEEVSEEESAYKGDIGRYKVLAKHIIDPPIRGFVNDLSQYNVLKMRKIMQSVFYLLRYKREDICYPKSNRIWWKKARPLINESFFSKLENYSPLGANPVRPPKYSTIAFIEKNVEGIKEEDVMEYSIGLCMLYKWLKLSFTLRKLNVKFRKESKVKKDQARADLITKKEDAAKHREEALNAAVEAAKAEFKPPENCDDFENEEDYLKACEFKFNKEQFLKEYDEQNPAIEIPEPAPEEVDLDIALEVEQPPAA